MTVEVFTYHNSTKYYSDVSNKVNTRSSYPEVFCKKGALRNFYRRPLVAASEIPANNFFWQEIKTTY